MSQVRPKASRQFPMSVKLFAVLMLLALGYMGGMNHNRLLAIAGPYIGIAAAGETIDLSSVQSTYRALLTHYDGDIDENALIEGAHRGLVEATGDDYTRYLSREESSEFNEALKGSIGGGIGVELGVRNDRITAIRVLDGNPGAEAGLRAGDIIAGINDEYESSWSIDDVVSRIRGEVGTTVKLTVLRGGEKLDFTITRDEISNPSVYSSVKDGIGYLTISRFDDQTSSLSRQAARKFVDSDVDGVIVDLRGNSGGYLTAAQDVAGIWLDKKVVVSERIGGVEKEVLYSSSSPILNGVPTVVIVDVTSASASEILAGALRDHEAAKLVGETTFGKGSVQRLVDLPDGAQLKVTIARWFTPKGKNISETGIDPDVVVERTADDVNSGRDPQLDAARELL